MIYALGRVTTPYEAAKTFFKPSKNRKTISQGELGAWYTCKKELLREGLIMEIEQKANARRSKPIRADSSKYVEKVMEGLSNHACFGNEVLPLFAEYAPTVVDFLVKKNEQLIETENFSFPFVLFLLTRYLAPIVDEIQATADKTTLRRIVSFVRELPESQRKELSLPRDRQQEYLEVAFSLLSPQLLKEVLVKVGVNVFAGILFRKQQLDWLINRLNIGSEDDIQFVVETVKERDMKTLREAEQKDQRMREAAISCNHQPHLRRHGKRI